MALAVLLAACGTANGTAGTKSPASTTALAETTCDAFENRIWAQTAFDADPGGNAALDPDEDGLACENLGFGAAPALWFKEIPANAIAVELAGVTDGDTIEVVVDGVREPVRLIGVDAPEAGGPYQDVECFGPEASRFLAELLRGGGTLSIEKDREERDPYGRLLRWVWLDAGEGEVYLVNEALIRAGYAERYRDTPNRQYIDELIAAEEFARRHAFELWDTCDDTFP